MKVSQGLSILLFLTITSSAFVNHHAIFIAISAFSLIIGIRQYIQDKKELKAAIHYSRVKKTVSVWKRIGSIVLFIIFMIGVYTFIEFYKIELFKSGMHKYYLFVLLASVFANYYIKFVDSIRSFDLGIKLPGRNQKLINWKDIEHLSLTNSRVTIRNTHIKTNIRIDDRDKEDINAMIKTWQERSL